MVLNPDCVRDILLAVEKCPFNQTLNVDKLAAQLPNYDEETIWYACLKMGEGGLLNIITIDVRGAILPGINKITGMTYQGHEFLNAVRAPKVWRAGKDILDKTGTATIGCMKEIASKVASSVLEDYLARHGLL